MMKNIKNDNPQGFTLIEVLLYVAIVSIIFGGILAFMEIVFNVRTKQQAVAKVESSGNLIISTLTQNIRNAKSITLPAASSTSQSLNLVMKDGGISPVVVALSEGAIRISERGMSTTTLASQNVTALNLIFTNLSRSNTPGSLRFEFWLRHSNYERYFIGGASLRNN
jgi:prepilin-type N-terminal cleavage/methylation domain-containing protein